MFEIVDSGLVSCFASSVFCVVSTLEDEDDIVGSAVGFWSFLLIRCFVFRDAGHRLPFGFLGFL